MQNYPMPKLTDELESYDSEAEDQLEGESMKKAKKVKKPKKSKAKKNPVPADPMQAHMNAKLSFMKSKGLKGC